MKGNTTLKELYDCYRDGAIGAMKLDPEYLVNARYKARTLLGISDQALDENENLQAALQTHEDLATFYGFSLGVRLTMDLSHDLDRLAELSADNDN